MKDTKDIDAVLLQARKILHDINQPLTVIMARSELLLIKTPDGDPSHRSLDQIHQQAEKLSGLVDDLRNLIKSVQES